MENARKPKVAVLVTVPSTIRALYRPVVAAFVDAGLEVVVVSTPHDSVASWLPAGCRFVAVDMARAITPLRDLRALWRLVRLFRAERFDLIQYTTMKAQLLGATAAFVARAPLRVYLAWGPYFQAKRGLARRVFAGLDRFACALSTHIVVNSCGLVDTLADEGVAPRGRCEVIWHGSTCGIDLDLFDAARWAPNRAALRAQVGLPAQATVIGVFGRLTGDKGVNETVAAFDRIAGRHPHVYLLVAGVEEPRDPLLPETWRCIRTHPRIRRLGFQESLVPLYAAIDIFCLASYREGLPQSVLEAQAMELPVVCTDIVGCREAIADRETGFLVAPRSATALVEPLERLIADPVLRQTMGKRGSQRVRERFDMRDVVAAIVARWQGLLREGGRVQR